MARPTKGQVKTAIEELLRLQPLVDRFEELDQFVRQGMVELGMVEVVCDAGRVFVSASERMTIAPDLARNVLGEEMAEKIIRRKETVANPLLAALHELGEVTDGQMDDLREKAEKRTVISLHIRPLK